jgi:hypothetical protein
MEFLMIKIRTNAEWNTPGETVADSELKMEIYSLASIA